MGRRISQKGRWRRCGPTALVFLLAVIAAWINLFHGLGALNSMLVLDSSPSGPDTMHGSKHRLSLKVPYYVYENEELYWKNYTFPQGGVPENYSDFKHSDDYWLRQAALRHPQRTRDPERARLFFVPVLLNAVAERRMCIALRGGYKCFARPGEAYRFVDKKVAQSRFFGRSQGKDHVVVTSHWLDPPRKIPNLLRCNLINFEGYLPMPTNGTFLPNFYVGNSCYHPSTIATTTSTTIKKDFDFAMVAKMVDGNPDFDVRRDICQWLSETGHSVSRCGPGPQCPALAQARYGFHPRGDTWGSNRVLDTVLARTVPLFTDARQYDLLPPFVPWRNLSYLVNVSDKETFLRDLATILAKPISEYESRLRLIDEYQFLFDHTDIYQFDAYMSEFAHRLGLQ